MYTRCPTCSTCFRVTDRHLSIAKGKVRCGQCQLVFNALEHAIDDLPVPSVTQTQPPETKIKKPLTPAPVNKIPPAPIAPTAKEKREENLPSTEQIKSEIPIFNSDATMIADISTLDKNEVENISLDTSFNPQDTINEDDDVFDNSFDLNAAIDELTQSSEDEQSDITTIEIEESSPAKENFANLPRDDKEDVFHTDAYDSTNASSVTDILSEMEGQLSLDIAKPQRGEVNKKYDANREFDFLKLDDESDNKFDDKGKSENTEEDLVDEFVDLNDEPTQTEHFDIELDDNKIENKNSIDEDALFDQIDLSDFEDSEVGENIVLEDPVFENSKLQNIGQHADELDVPIQLRNDIAHLKSSSLRSWHPLLAPSFIVILLIISFSQLTFFRAHDLVEQIPSTRPLLEAFCEKVGCHYSGPRDTKQIQLLSRDVRLHPKEKKALLISAAMINNAYFDQPYPDIHIRLSDISGNVVAERIFDAKTYMGKLSNPFLLMKSKTPVHINFEVVDPGKDAINFEFTFL